MLTFGPNIISQDANWSIPNFSSDGCWKTGAPWLLLQPAPAPCTSCKCAEEVMSIEEALI